MTETKAKIKIPDEKRDYRGADAPEAKIARELKDRLVGHPVKLMPCKPFFRSARSRRQRQHTWVRI